MKVAVMRGAERRRTDTRTCRRGRIFAVRCRVDTAIGKAGRVGPRQELDRTRPRNTVGTIARSRGETTGSVREIAWAGVHQPL